MQIGKMQERLYSRCNGARVVRRKEPQSGVWVVQGRNHRGQTVARSFPLPLPLLLRCDFLVEIWKDNKKTNKFGAVGMQ